MWPLLKYNMKVLFIDGDNWYPAINGTWVTSIWDSFILFLPFFAIFQHNSAISYILINRKAPTFHCVLIILSFSMFVQAKIRQKLNVVPKTKGH